MFMDPCVCRKKQKEREAGKKWGKQGESVYLVAFKMRSAASASGRESVKMQVLRSRSTESETLRVGSNNRYFNKPLGDSGTHWLPEWQVQLKFSLILILLKTLEDDWWYSHFPLWGDMGSVYPLLELVIKLQILWGEDIASQAFLSKEPLSRGCT